MHETKEKVRKICSMMSRLNDAMDAKFAQGLECVDIVEAGQVIDMIKDLADAEKNIWKACYYKKIVEAMDECKEEAEKQEDMPWYLSLIAGRAGYDNYRYASSGRFAPKGKGTRYGYVPMVDPMMGKSNWNMENMRMGYPDGRSGDMRSTEMPRSGYMIPYDMYLDSRRHYTETGSEQDRNEMRQHATEHMEDTVETVKDIWKDADPDLRKKMKMDLQNLVNEMKV